MIIPRSPAGRASEPYVAGSTCGAFQNFDIQLFADDDDDDDPAPLEIGALSDDPQQLKGLIRQMISENSKVRRQAASRRVRNKKLQEFIDKLQNEHPTALNATKAELKTAHDADLKRIKDENAAALAAVVTERDGIVSERDALKGEKDTLNKSNSQLRGRFRTQFVDKHVSAELAKRITIADEGVKAKALAEHLKLMDLSKIDFDEEKLDIKDPAKLTADLDAFVKERPWLTPAGAQQQQQRRGTSFGRGSSDNNGSSNGGAKVDFSDESRSIGDLTADVLRQEGII